MKNLYLVIIALIISSCCSTKKVVENTKKEEPKEIVQVENTETEIPIVVEEEIIETTEPTITEEPIKTIPVLEQETIIANTEVFNHDAWNNLLQKHVTNTGNVNYKDFKSNRKALTNYISALGKNRPKDTWTKEDKIAYWINAYNAFTVDLILRNYPVKSIKDIKEPWKQRFWQLGEKWYNLDEIEHQILRKMDEPRIHFAIVCASFSCPKLQNEAFAAGNLEAQLTKATKDFLSDTNRNEISSNSLKISKIFKWFSKDFKNNGSVLDFINKYTSVNISNKAKISYKDYKWDLND